MKSKFTARETAELLVELLIRRLGGKGSGNFGHAGRPGKIGGSAESPIAKLERIADGAEFISSASFFGSADIPQWHPESDFVWGDPELVSISDLVPDEVDLNVAGIRRYIESKEQKPINVVFYDGRYHIQDGNHRTAAELLKGNTEILARLGRVKRRVLEGGGEDTLLHKAADAHVPDLKVALRYAFAAVRKRMQGRKIDELENVLPKMLQEELEAVLPGALTRAAISGASIALQLKTLGGKGSGNFGHAGRPGQVGGSAPDEFPEGLVKVSGPKGTNPGGVFRDKEGRKWYVKQYKDADQAAGEHIANAVYSRIGVDAADSRLSADGKTIALRWEDGKVLNQHGLDPDTANRVLDGFAGDVLLQNWDAVGTGHDNVLVRPDGSVMRVDQGGTLLHRAQGALKPEVGRHEIREWESLQTFNPYYAEVFKRAGVASGDALGERVAKQIDRIVHGRPEGGWEVLVSKVAPLASPSYKKAVSGMLEARQGLLEKKRDALRMKTLGGPGSGHFGHSGRPGKVGGSADSDIVIVKKAKAPPATKEQIATAVAMKAEGKSYAEIQTKTGLNPKQAATIVHKHKKAQAAALKAITTPSNDWAKKPVSPVENSPGVANLLAKGHVWKQTDIDGKWAFFDKKGAQVTGYFPPEDIEEAAIFANVALNKETSGATAPAAAPATPAEHTLDTLKAKGFEWKEKTTGPNKGKYAFFQNGVQVSAFSPKDAWKTAVPTIHFNKGPDYVAPEPPPKVTPNLGGIGGSGLHADVLGKAETLAPWPIADDVPRFQGSTTPKILMARGQAWSSKLTSEEREAVQHYTGSGSSTINKSLMHGTKASKYTKSIDSALAKADPPPPPELVWRGVGSVDPHKLIASLETGDIISLKSFQSTSINPETGFGWSGGKTVFEIKPNKGAFVKPISYHAHEQEFLLPRGAQYIVRGAKKVKFGTSSHEKFIIQLEMLP